MRDYIGALLKEPGDAEHHGVKGMKWGVRRNLQKMDPSKRAGYLAEKERKMAKKLDDPYRLSQTVRMANRDAKRQVKALNKELKAKGINLKKDPAARSEYEAKANNAIGSAMNNAAAKVYGKSKTGLYEARIVHNDTGQVKAVLTVKNNPKIVKQMVKIQKSDTKRAAKEVKHSDIKDDGSIELTLSLDEEGYIVGIDDLVHADYVGDYMASQELEEGDLEHHGVKGMKWGIRRTDSQLAKDTKSRAASGKAVTPTKKAATLIPTSKKNADIAINRKTGEVKVLNPGVKALTGEETSSQRYDRLAGMAKAGRAHEMNETDLKFFNARTDALAKVNKMNETNPSWLRETSKKVLQQAAQNTMQSVADGVAKKYISGPILEQINGAETKK